MGKQKRFTSKCCCSTLSRSAALMRPVIAIRSRDMEHRVQRLYLVLPVPYWSVPPSCCERALDQIEMELQAPTSKQAEASNVGYQNLPRNRTDLSRDLSTPASGYEQECHAAARCSPERVVGGLVNKNGNARTRPILLSEKSLERERKMRSSKVT
mgnify:CR=1 FL=1